MFGLVDCDNFFVSCERVFNPSLLGKPVVVLSNNDGCIIARSNEAKALGLKMGTPFFQVKKVLEKEKVAVFSSNFPLYTDMSRRVMSLLKAYTPSLLCYSIDEAFLDLSGYSYSALQEIGISITKEIRKSLGIPLSLGIAPTKTLSKMGSKYAKKYPAFQSVCIIDTPQKREKALQGFPIQDVWGIGKRSLIKLQSMGIKSAWDFTQLPITKVQRLLSVTGGRTWKELRGESCIDIDDFSQKKSIATTRSFSGAGIDVLADFEKAIANFAADCARKLRGQGTCCQKLTVFGYTDRFLENGPEHAFEQSITLDYPSSSSTDIVSAALEALRKGYLRGFRYKKAGVICTQIIKYEKSLNYLFSPDDQKKQAKLSSIVDQINDKNGPNFLRIATQGNSQELKIKHEYRSRSFTTKLSDIIQIH